MGRPHGVDLLVTSTQNIKLLHREQRRMAIKVARVYGTTPWEAACVLAGSGPWMYVARSLAETHEWEEELAHGGKPKIIEARRNRAKAEIPRHWGKRFSHTRAGLRVVEEIGPVLEEWMRRGHGGFFFHLTQVLSGHRCFE